MNLAKDVIVYFVSKITPAIASIYLISVLMSGLPLEEYGKYSLYYTTVLLVIQLTGTWLNNCFIYIFPRADHHEKRRQIVTSEILKISLVLIIATIAIIIGLMKYHNASMVVIISFVALSVVLMVNGILFTLTQIQYKTRVQLKSSLLLGFFLITSITMMGLTNVSIWAGALSLVLANSVSAVYLAIANKSYLSRQLLKMSSRLTRKGIFSYGRWMTLWMIPFSILSYSDKIILSTLLEDNFFGGYAAIKDILIGVSAFLLMPISLATNPKLRQLWVENNRYYFSKIQKAIFILISIIFSIGALTYDFWMPILTRIFTNKDISSYFDITPLILGSIGIFFLLTQAFKFFEYSNNVGKMVYYGYIALTGYIISFIAGFWVNGVSGFLLMSNFIMLLVIVLILFRVKKMFERVEVNSFIIPLVGIFIFTTMPLYLPLSVRWMIVTFIFFAGLIYVYKFDYSVLRKI
jgi:O-antigen/teichoic acid export membrane protein